VNDFQINDDLLIGISVPTIDTETVLTTIREAEKAGIDAAWLTSGGEAGDALTSLAVAASQTDHIMLGTSILRTWTRHPIVTARQAQSIANIAPGRLRLGIGPSHRDSMTETFGFKFFNPLGHLREYVTILTELSHRGKVAFEGNYYKANFEINNPINVPIMASALRPASFEMCGQITDGAISWVCPYTYLKDTAMTSLNHGATEVGREPPPMVVHAPICLTDDLGKARNAVREQLGYFPLTPFYKLMFESAGFKESDKTGWTDDMLDAVLIAGSEDVVIEKLNEISQWGGAEILATIVTVDNTRESMKRTMKLLGEI